MIQGDSCDVHAKTEKAKVKWTGEGETVRCN